jgi:hypothetical protein
MPQAIESTAAAKSAISAPVNAPRRPRALRTARRSIAQAPRRARCSATSSALGPSSVPATRPSASNITRSATVQAQRQGNVLGDGERWQQVEGLEYEPDPLTPQDRQPPLAQVRQVGIAERNAP